MSAKTNPTVVRIRRALKRSRSELANAQDARERAIEQYDEEIARLQESIVSDVETLRLLGEPETPVQEEDE